MNTVTVSPKFQVVIPLSIRKSAGIQAGEKMQVLCFDDRIELIPIKSIKSMRGFIKGKKNVFQREKRDRI
ncbi:MAG: AbrB/MazE/SpoVT family DNA-binding domain-containing protein [Candidatus Omnitrophica bacterium]|nr:AbrB/MazE/SpoVT family DNA-binding domain-containing protein [Candidatus Omnitrophota bacterium]MCB9747832.1 AbrB/MazE/SpoVT family DNA-binding domain-containing protein [Candidatus Omnitrophota bacterium]